MTATDFSDKLSPMLVKELRQGLRAKVFLWSFVLIQVAMILMVGARVLAASFQENLMAGVFDGVFWWVLGLVLLLLLPSRASSLIQEERKDQTLELLQMTWLSTWRIVVGKWLAVVTLGLLVVVALLPYMVLRYFFGGMDVVGTLGLLLTMMLGSGALTALALYGSATNQRVASGLLVPLLMGFSVLMSVVDSFRGGSAMDDIMRSALLLAPAYTLLFLLQTTARIAPEAENVVWRLRVLTWVSVLAGGLLSWWLGDYFWLGGVLPLALWVCLQSLTTLPSTLPCMYAWGAVRGLRGKLWNRLLTPGWGSGVGFCILTWLLVMCCNEQVAVMTNSERLIWALLLPALLFPLAIFRAVGWHGVPWGLYLLTQTICWAVGLVVDGTKVAGKPSVGDWLLSLTPTGALTSQLTKNVDYLDSEWEVLMGLVLPMAAVTVLICLWAARRQHQLTTLLEKRALQEANHPMRKP